MKNSETLMLQDVWRQAYLRDEGLTIDFATKSGATRARMQLYNAVKRQKAGTDLDDAELSRAADELEIVWVGETSIKLQRKDKNDMMQSIQAALGKHLADYVDPEAAESAERLLRSLEGTKPTTAENPEGFEHKENPFYKRQS